MGTADTPAEPIRGLTFRPVSLHITLPPHRPPAVEMPKATTPRTTIFRVLAVRKVEPTMVAPTAGDSRMVTMFISAFCAVSLRRSVAPVSLNRLPSIRQPIRGAVSGSSSATKITTTMGKMIFSALDTVRVCTILILRSSAEVSRFMMGGWISGISAM